MILTAEVKQHKITTISSVYFIFISCFSSSPDETFFKKSLRILTEIPLEKKLNSNFNFSNEVSTTVSFISEFDAPLSRFSSLSSSLDIPPENEISLIENQEKNVVLPSIFDIKQYQDLEGFISEKRRITFSKLPDYTDVKELETDSDCDSIDHENVNPNELENYYDSKIGVLQHGR